MYLCAVRCESCHKSAFFLVLFQECLIRSKENDNELNVVITVCVICAENVFSIIVLLGVLNIQFQIKIKSL